jgi:sulfoxide reductase catalytic subunit YedY
MHLLRDRPWHLPSRELTDETAWQAFASRRRFLKHAARGSLAAGALIAGAGAATIACRPLFATNPNESGPGRDLPLAERYEDLLLPGFPAKRNDAYTLDRPLTAEAVAAGHNNFYEFTANKAAVHKHVGDFIPRPWTIEITGAVEKPFTLDLDDIAKLGFEERSYRFRCVEAWAMAVPWTGVPLRRLIERCAPLSKARFVRFVSFHRPEQARGQRVDRHYPWPYYEALRMKEATHELAMLATGIFGHALPRQHGAPVRLITPWKYGYKQIKSIVKIEFTEVIPRTFWNDLQSREYDFAGNVNPRVPHPRWSQAKEKMIGTGQVRDSQWLNGYAAQLADLYPRQPVKHGWQDVRSPF